MTELNNLCKHPTVVTSPSHMCVCVYSFFSPLFLPSPYNLTPIQSFPLVILDLLCICILVSAWFSFCTLLSVSRIIRPFMYSPTHLLKCLLVLIASHHHCHYLGLLCHPPSPLRADQLSVMYLLPHPQ